MKYASNKSRNEQGLCMSTLYLGCYFKHTRRVFLLVIIYVANIKLYIFIYMCIYIYITMGTIPDPCICITEFLSKRE